MRVPRPALTAPGLAYAVPTHLLVSIIAFDNRQDYATERADVKLWKRVTPEENRSFRWT